MRARVLLLGAMIFFAGGLARAENIFDGSHTRTQIRSTLDDFLTGLGYQSFSDNIQKNIDKKTGWGPRGQQTLKFNRDRYRIFDYSKDLAKIFGEELATRPKDDRLREETIKFTSRLLSIKPLPVPADTLHKDLAKEVRKNVIAHANLVVQDAIHALYGADAVQRLKEEIDSGKRLSRNSQAMANNIKKVSELAAKMVEHMYVDPEMGGSREPGRALALVLAFQADQSKDPEVMPTLARLTKQQGADLRNYVGNVLVFPGKDAEEHLVEGKTGDFWNERTREGEAGQIVGAAIADKKNRAEAREKKLSGLLVSGGIYPTDPSPTAINAARLQLASLPVFTKGVSHVGMGELLTKFNISTYRILDVYPSSRPWNPKDPKSEQSGGGIRYISVDQFATVGPMMRVARTRYDPKSLRKLARQQLRDKGYEKEAWIGKLWPTGPDGQEDRSQEPEPVVWKTVPSLEEFYDLNTLPFDMSSLNQGQLKSKIKNLKGVPKDVEAWAEALNGQRYMKIPIEVQRWLERNSDQIKTPENRGWFDALAKDTLPEEPQAVEKWISESFARAVEQMKRTYLEKYGTEFATGFTDNFALYCTKNVWMAFKQANGINLQKYPDRWSWKIRGLRAIGNVLPFKWVKNLLKPVLDLDPGAIFAPGTFAWQKDLVHGKQGRFDMVDFPPMTLVEQEQAVTLKKKPQPLDSQMGRLLASIGDKVPVDAEQHISEDLLTALQTQFDVQASKFSRIGAPKLINSGGVNGTHMIGVCARRAWLLARRNERNASQTSAARPKRRQK